MKKTLIIFGLIALTTLSLFLFIEVRDIQTSKPPIENEITEKLIKANYFEKYKLGKKFVILVDFSFARNKKRLWVMDKGEVLANSYTSHGGKSKSFLSFLPPKYFSNEIGSKKSSIGIYKICLKRNMDPSNKHFCTCLKFKKNKKCSHAGKKFPLYGMEKTNSNSMDRGIIIHTSKYVSENGCTGNSDGCFVVSPEIFDLINKKVGSFRSAYLIALK